MTGDEFTAALKRLHIKQADLMRNLQMAQSTVSRWATGELPIPSWMPYLLQLLEERQEHLAIIGKRNRREAIRQRVHAA